MRGIASLPIFVDMVLFNNNVPRSLAALRWLMVFISFFSMSCERDYNGSFDVQGYCYDSCGGSPLVNYRVSVRPWEGNDFETFTDSVGYFKLKGSYSFKYHISKEPTPVSMEFFDVSNLNDCCRYFELRENSKFTNDTLYGYNVMRTVLRVKILPNNGSTDKDTLFVSYRYSSYDGVPAPRFRSNTSTYSINYNTFYVGPFENNQILDTLKTRVGAHVGFSDNGNVGYQYRGPNVGSGGTTLWHLFIDGQKNIRAGHIDFLEIEM